MSASLNEPVTFINYSEDVPQALEYPLNRMVKQQSEIKKVPLLSYNDLYFSLINSIQAISHPI